MLYKSRLLDSDNNVKEQVKKGEALVKTILNKINSSPECKAVAPGGFHKSYTQVVDDYVFMCLRTRGEVDRSPKKVKALERLVNRIPTPRPIVSIEVDNKRAEGLILWASFDILV